MYSLLRDKAAFDPCQASDLERSIEVGWSILEWIYRTIAHRFLSFISSPIRLFDDSIDQISSLDYRRLCRRRSIVAFNFTRRNQRNLLFPFLTINQPNRFLNTTMNTLGRLPRTVLRLGARCASSATPPSASLGAAQSQLPPLALLRGILRAHRKLPPALRYMGDRYVLDEFKRHKAADAKFVVTFLAQWNSYLDTIKAQVAREEVRGALGVFADHPVDGEGVGRRMTPEELEKMSDAQVGQLYALRLV